MCRTPTIMKIREYKGRLFCHLPRDILRALAIGRKDKFDVILHRYTLSNDFVCESYIEMLIVVRTIYRPAFNPPKTVFRINIPEDYMMVMEWTMDTNIVPVISSYDRQMSVIALRPPVRILDAPSDFLNREMKEIEKILIKRKKKEIRDYLKGKTEIEPALNQIQSDLIIEGNPSFPGMSEDEFRELVEEK